MAARTPNRDVDRPLVAVGPRSLGEVHTMSVTVEVPDYVLALARHRYHHSDASTWWDFEAFLFDYIDFDMTFIDERGAPIALPDE